MKTKNGLVAWQWQKVNSSVIDRVGFSQNCYHTVLRIVFLSGRTYDYWEVPWSAFKEMIAANSVGSYYNEYIKNYYQSQFVLPRLIEKPVLVDRLIPSMDNSGSVEQNDIDEFVNNLGKKDNDLFAFVPQYDNAGKGDYVVKVVAGDKQVIRTVLCDKILNIIDSCHRLGYRLTIYKIGEKLVDWT